MSRASATAASRLRAEVTNYINTQPLIPQASTAGAPTAQSQRQATAACQLSTQCVSALSHRHTSPAAQHDRQLTHPGPGRVSPPYQTRTRCDRASRRRPVPLRSPHQRYRPWRTARPQTLPSRKHKAHPTAAAATANKDRPGPPTPPSHRLSRPSPQLWQCRSERRSTTPG